MPKATPDEVQDAEALLAARWRQASVFRPPEGTDVSVHGGFDRTTEWLVACTQSCNVVSPSFEANPLVEVMVAKPVAHFRKESYEASGRHVRTFHMEAEGDPDVRAVACDIVRRCFLPRRLLLGCQRSTMVPSKRAARGLAGWLSRYYGRTAFPNELVRRASAKGELFPTIEKVLKTTAPDGKPLNEYVRYIYVYLSTEDELHEGDGRHYEMRMLFLCRNANEAVEVGRRLDEKLESYGGGVVENGISLDYDVQNLGLVSLAQLDGYERFPEWDHMSGLEEARESYSSPPPEA